jgi:hypothetical protein
MLARNKVYKVWLEIVQAYFAYELIFESDLFPAICGLSRRFNKTLEDTYVAGSWRGDLIRSLLWHGRGPRDIYINEESGILSRQVQFDYSLINH